MDQKDINDIVAGVTKALKPKIKVTESGELDLYGKVLATSSVVTVLTVQCPEDEWWYINIFSASDDHAISSGSIKFAKRRAMVEEVTDFEVGFQSNPSAGAIYFANAAFWVFPGQKLVAVFTGAAANDKLELWATGTRFNVSKE